MSDRILGVIALIISAIYIWTARGFDPGFMSDPLGPGTFPYLLGTVFACTGIYVILRPDESAQWPDIRHIGEMVIVIAVLLAYAGFLEYIGFLIATMLTAGFLSWRLGASFKTAVITGLLVSLIVYGLFDRLLELPLPAGLLGK